MEQDYDLAVEELKEAKNPLEKQMLLQKYGLIDPKLTPEEQELTLLEAEVKAVFGSTFRLGTFEELGL